MYGRKVIFIFLLAAGLAACSTTRSLSEGEYLLRKNTIVADDPSFQVSSLGSYIGHKPNSYVLGVNPLLSVYNWSGDGSTSFRRFLRKIGSQPVIYDPEKVSQGVANLQNHLQYIGFYGSQVESKVDVKKKKAYVTYSIKLGKRYKISEIEYEIPEYGSFSQEFAQDLPNSTLAAGDFLSEAALEKEAERSSAYFRNLGYFGFTKSFYIFEADTLSQDGKVRLKETIRDYALGDSPESARMHRKFKLGKVSITHPEKPTIRTSTLENLNILRPGQLYSEQEINTNYSRFSSVGMLTGVNIELNPVTDTTVDCNISLRSSRLQGFKLNLEASVNSTGLVGVSPQLNYYHRNIFRGGEQFNLGLTGNFQFQPRTKAYSTELNVTTTLRFPKFIGLPNRVFKGPNIPRTDITAAFTYQDRPEFRRTVISTAFTYNGRIGNKLYYQLSPLRLNVTHLYNMDKEFMERLFLTNPFVFMAYQDKFDLGVSSMFYYTTNAATVPQTPYHYARLAVDVSGNVLSLFKSLLPQKDQQYLIWQTPYAQYVRFDLNLGKVFRFGKEDRQALALHWQSGAAFAYGNSTAAPVEKHFYAGGAMSMRGWQARALGPGTTDAPYGFAIPSQIGDLKIEANIEYRFPLISKLEGALFVDAGNVWFLSGEDSASKFSFANFPEGIAMDWGFGFRLNLNLILIRLDMGIRLRDPARAKEERWVPTNEWLNGNYGIHFGVGYPF